MNDAKFSVKSLAKEFWYRAYKKNLKRYIPGIIFRTKDASILLFYKSIFTLKKKIKSNQNNILLQSDPKITIGIASYNHSIYLKQCIESALDQDYKKFDVLIVDDNSTDPKNKEILEGYKSNPKVTIVYKEKNEGISASLNAQVIGAKGDWVAFVDCDDYLPKNALSEMVKYIKNNPEKKLIFSNRIEVDENNKVLQKVWFGNRTLNKNVFHELMKGMVSSHLKLIHKDAFRKVGLFDDRFGGTHDYDMYLKVAFYMPEAFGYVDEYLYYHRIHASQNTIVESEKHKKNVEKMQEEFCFREKVYCGKLEDLISIVILSFNRGARLKKTIDKILFHARNLNKEIIIWDNGSTNQETLEILKELEKEKEIKVIFSKENLRCSGGRKAGAEIAKGEYVVFFDNDIEIQDGTIEELIIRLHEDDKIAGACCRLIFPDYNIQFNGGEYAIEGNLISFKLIDSGKNMQDVSTMSKKECGWIPGGATIFRKNIFSQIEHDVTFLNAFEDNDFSLAVTKKLGLKVSNCPTAVAFHYHVKFEFTHKTGTKEYLHARANDKAFIKSWRRFYEKWNLIINDDFIIGLAGLTGRKNKDIQLYLEQNATKE